MATAIVTLPKVDTNCLLDGAFLPRELAAVATRVGREDKADEAAWRQGLAFSDAAGLARARALVLDLLVAPGAAEAAGDTIGRRWLGDFTAFTELRVPMLELQARGADPVTLLQDLDRGLWNAFEDRGDTWFAWGEVADYAAASDPEEARRSLEVLLEAGLPGLAALCLHGADAAHPLSAHAALIALARQHELGVMAEVGYGTDAAAIGAALDLGVQRILGGHAALRSDEMLQRLRVHRVPVVVCPTLETRLGLARSYDRHPVARMAAQGIFLAVGSGAPGILGQTFGEELEHISKVHKWRLSDLRNANARAVEAGCIDPRFRFHLARTVETWDPRLAG
jgi:hypothetical protein